LIHVEGNVVQGPQHCVLYVGAVLAKSFVVGVVLAEREEGPVEGLEGLWRRCPGRRGHTEPADLDQADLPEVAACLGTEQFEGRLEVVVVPVSRTRNACRTEAGLAPTGRTVNCTDPPEGTSVCDRARQ
jgi:hypothetical protein